MANKKLLRDVQKYKQHLEESLHTFRKNKPHHDRMWFMSVLFQRGEQWLTFETAVAQFRRSNQRRLIPRPVTNIYASIGNSLISALLKFDPRNVFAPQTDTQEDVNTALAGNKIINAIEHEVLFERRKAELVPWIVLTGNGFLIPGIDASRGPQVDVWKLICTVCGEKDESIIDNPEQMPNCQRCYSEDDVRVPLQPQLNALGEPIIHQERAGKLGVDVVSPFEMFLDSRITDIQNHSTVIRIHTKALSWAKTQWPDVAEKLKPCKRDELNARIVSTLGGLTYPTADAYAEDTVDIVEIWQLPSKAFPKGFYGVLVGDTFVELDEYKWLRPDGEAYLPIIHFPYDRVPGSFWGRTPMLDLIDKQRTRNRIESIGEMILMRMSNPVWIAPNPGTATVPSGHVGQIIYYDPHQSGGSVPQRVEASVLPPSFIQWMDRIDKEMREIPGIAEVLQGERPLSVKSGFAIQKLEEIARGRNTSLYHNYSLAVADFQMIAFEMFRKLSPEKRYARILGDNQAWTVSKIKEADLQGGMDVWVEPGSSVPKTHLEKLATLESLIQMGLVDLQDPMQRLRIYREYGMSDLLPSMDVDDQFISREHDRFKNGGQLAVSPFDNHQMHLQRHLEFWKSELFETLPEEATTAFLRHLQETQQIVQQQQQAAMEQQMQMQAMMKGAPR